MPLVDVGVRLKKSLQPIVFLVRPIVSSIRRRILGQRVSALLSESQQGSFLFDPEDLGVARLFMRTGSYGTEELARISSLTDQSSSVLFVGSHVGVLAVPVSKRVERVTAIEANPQTFRLLAWNILLNGCSNIKAVQIAANDSSGELEFVQSTTNSGGSKRIPHLRAREYFYDHPSVIKVPANRLDDVLHEDFDLIVMDIEGSEVFALRGMPRILSRAKALIIEYLPHHLRQVANVSVADFLAPIAPNFDELFIPSKSLSLKRADFQSALEVMYRKNEEDQGIVFSRSCPTDGLTQMRGSGQVVPNRK